MKNKLYNALFSELNPYFYIKVKDGRSETGNKESYYGKIPRDDRCTFDISNNKVLVHMGESGKIKAANFYRDCYPADDIPGVWMHKDFSSRCGKRRRPNTSCAGLRRGATGSPAGTWSARP